MRRIEHGAVRAPVPGIFPGMGQVHAWVDVHCAQCGDRPASLNGEAYWPPEDAALDAAAAEGWRVGPGGRLWCSACAPVLTCEAEGHEFSGWRRPVTRDGRPASSEYRHCRRCCVCESQLAALQAADVTEWSTGAAMRALLADVTEAGEVA
ncbi:MAG: hypothetical protein WCF33_00730 [Pseudonocardiaceae bacterium]